MDTGATICFLNSQTSKAIKTYLSPSIYELKKDVDTKLGTANSQLLPTEGTAKLTLLPFRDHLATLSTTFAIADTNYSNFGIPFLQTYCETLDTERSCPIPKNKVHHTVLLMQIPFLQISHTQPPFCSKVFSFAVNIHINISDRHIQVIKLHLKNFTKYFTKITSKTGVPSFQLVQQQYKHLKSQKLLT